MSQTATPRRRGRYAPTPSGRLHLGNARTALVAWARARAAGASFVLRVEDLDPQRCRPEFEEDQLRDLRWLGIDWDEGPDVGGPHAPYRQSERLELYEAAVGRLQTYPCTCTRAQLRAHALYPGTCREQGPRPGKRAGARVNIPPGPVTVHDAAAGSLTQDVREAVGDFLVRRRDGVFAYQLAVVVDDGAMAVEEVVRGMDLWDNTPRQVMLQRMLELPSVSYLHVPLMLASGGKKLSKSDDAPDLTQLREAGVDPTLVVGYLAYTLGHDVPSRISAADAVEVLARPPTQVTPTVVDETPTF